jgi:hypothetical protein
MPVIRLSGGLTPGDPSDPRTFPAIWNETADVIDANEAGVVALGTAVDGKLSLSGGTLTGSLTAPNVRLGVITAGSDSVALDFSTDGFVSRQVSGTAVAVTASGYLAGRTKTLRLVGGTAVASVTVPSDWKFVGGAAGTALGTATTAILTATAFGTAASSVVAAWAESV